VLAQLVFLSPTGALLALAVVLPLAGVTLAAARQARIRAALALPSARLGAVEVACLVAVPLLLAFAATDPAIRSAAGRPLLDSTEAIFVFDVSRSMAASPGRHAPTRLDRAKGAAEQLRSSIPDVRAGVASITTQLLPELFPTPDEGAFTGTVKGAIGVLTPPPPAFQIIATTFDPLASLRDQGFFGPGTKHRVAILLTDGETTRYFPENVGQRLAAARPPQTFFGRPQAVQAPVKLIVVRFGSGHDRIYKRGGGVDAGYRPDLHASQDVGQLVQAANGRLFDESQLGAATRALRADVESGRTSGRTTTTRTTRLAPFVALAAFVPLAFILWRLNLQALGLRWPATGTKRPRGDATLQRR
jgi:hypothetical protein